VPRLARAEIVPAALPHVRERSTRTPRALLLLRRIHLYTGLFLLPWVLLYGVTAFFFNHPGAFTATSVRVLDERALEGSAFAQPIDPQALAVEVTSALREHARAQRPAGTPHVFGEPRQARMSGGFAFLAREERGDGSVLDHNLRAEWDGRAARLATRPGSAESESAGDRAPFAVARGLGLDPDPVEERRRDVSGILAASNVDAADATVRGAPVLEFDLTVDGAPWRATYKLREQSLAAHPVQGEREALPARSFLTRLHQMHGYPADFGARSLWALIVDVMAASMVCWAVSGLLMWWPMKRLRVPGAIAIGLSQAAAAPLGASHNPPAGG
jgi:hypothetical protein